MMDSKSRMQKAFQLLASAELGSWPLWRGPSNEASLVDRVQALAVLHDVVPAARQHQIDTIALAWSHCFSSERIVSGKELRRSARQCIRPERVPVNEFAVGPSGQARKDLEIDDLEFKDTERRCLRSLETWRDKLKMEPRWTHLSSAIPGDKPEPMHDAYVPLHLVESPASMGVVGSSHQNGKSSKAHPRLTIESVVNRTSLRCVIVGDPGSGKSTLIQHLAFSIVQRQFTDFDTPIVIHLAAYARRLSTEPGLSLLEFFFESLVGQNHCCAVAEWLRNQPQYLQRILLLLDGWDEVPEKQQESVRRSIELESAHFVSVVTSRPSGLPRSL